MTFISVKNILELVLSINNVVGKITNIYSQDCNNKTILWQRLRKCFQVVMTFFNGCKRGLSKMNINVNKMA